MRADSPDHPVPQAGTPLAERLRPPDLDAIVGQDHLIGPGRPLRRAIERGELHSMILWGPPGCGKTSLALTMARYTRARFVRFSAVSAGVRDVRAVVAEAERDRTANGSPTVLFVDEIHRFNKAQQDAFLPHVESGLVVMVGATTENPSFEVIAPLLSRTRVYVLEPLGPDEVKTLMRRALESADGLARLAVEMPEDALDLIALVAQGDARAALTALELVAGAAEPGPDGRRRPTVELTREVIQRKFLLYDRSGEQHYNLISALHKSLRDSDPDGALYWLARMLEAGEDPNYVARRLVRFASEDVGMANPNALVVAVAARQALEFIGLPEGNTALAEAVIYLALAPKSNATYVAYETAKRDALETPTVAVPLHLRNAPTRLMKDLGYGRGYKYAHDFDGARVEQQHLPPGLEGRRYYRPTDRGFEAELRRRGSARGQAKPDRDAEPPGAAG
ncbi:MAG: replication-associated recombination protein A [bacterium]